MCTITFFEVVVDVVTELARECVLLELLYADELVLMSEIIKEFRREIQQCLKSDSIPNK